MALDLQAVETELRWLIKKVVPPGRGSPIAHEALVTESLARLFAPTPMPAIPSPGSRPWTGPGDGPSLAQRLALDGNLGSPALTEAHEHATNPKRQTIAEYLASEHDGKPTVLIDREQKPHFVTSDGVVLSLDEADAIIRRAKK